MEDHPFFMGILVLPVIVIKWISTWNIMRRIWKKIKSNNMCIIDQRERSLNQTNQRIRWLDLTSSHITLQNTTSRYGFTGVHKEKLGSGKRFCECFPLPSKQIKKYSLLQSTNGSNLGAPIIGWLPSGKQPHNYVKDPPCYEWENPGTSMATASIAFLSHNQRVYR